MFEEPGPAHLVFSFGTLLDPQVQQELFSRQVPVIPDSLVGHGITDVPIDDPDVVRLSGLAVHRGLVRDEEQEVAGGILALTDEELGAADEYEVSAYARRRVMTAGRGMVWAYVDARPLAVAQRIGLVGDSIAYGRTDERGGWAHEVATVHIGANERQHRFFNLAIPGITARELSVFAADEVRRRRCDTVLVACGVNDLIHDQAGPDDVVARLESLVRQLESSGVRPVVMGPLWNDEKRIAGEFGAELATSALEETNARLSSWAGETHRDFIDVYGILRDRTEVLSDGLHPDADGHRDIAAFVIATQWGPRSAVHDG
ncbi:MAG: GDSL-type esterase/lipase family protein [Propioniciclava sp.]|uniref:GDSL-type esterase/lipase family protein n=1 Tax=Propioniciclava sp. TaxID=2038686 RepID=UPI0039E6DA49